MPRNNGHKLHPRNRTHGLLSLSESQGTGRMSLWCSPKDMRSPWKKARSTRVPGTAAGHAFRCCRCCGFDHGLRHLRRWRSQTATGDKPPRSTRMISRATSPPRPCGCVCLVPGPPTERLRPGVRGGGPRDTRRQKFTLRRLSGKSFRQPRIRQLLPIGKIAKALQPERDKELLGRDKGIGSPSPR